MKNEMVTESLVRMAAFSRDPKGGNPAGVWIGEALPERSRMQEIAADIGYSETAFLAPAEEGAWSVRYYSPEAEVPFCGHATIASGVALGRRGGAGTFRLQTIVGEVPVEVVEDDGDFRATLTSVEPEDRAVPEALLERALDGFGWRHGELDPQIGPRLIFAGAWHLLLVCAEAERLARLDYDFERLKGLMLEHDLTTVSLVHRSAPAEFRSRNPFPVGGVVEDPATGAAAAALGGYLRSSGLVSPPVELTVRQGAEIGRPSRIGVEIGARGGIRVSGYAVELPDSSG